MSEWAQLESNHALQLSLLETSKDCDIARVEKEHEEAWSKLEAKPTKLPP